MFTIGEYGRCISEKNFIPFRTRLIFVGKVRSLPSSGAQEKCFTQIGSRHTCKHRVNKLSHYKLFCLGSGANPGCCVFIFSHFTDQPQWLTDLTSNIEGLYYKTIRIRNLWQMGRFRSKLVSFLLSVTNTLAYYRIHKLQICIVFT